MKHRFKPLAATLLFVSAACGKDPLPAASAANSFGIELYREISHQQGNLILSPLSISSALSMAWAGADGKTRTEMSEVLHLTDIDGNTGEQLKRIRTALAEETKGIRLDLANAAWLQKGYAKQAYLRRIEEDFGAPPQVVDFTAGAEKIRRKINRWVETKTKDRIKELVPPGVINELTRLVLVNAVYFKGSWDKPFDESLTRELPFHLTPDVQVSVSTMFSKRHCLYVENGTAQLVALRYKGGRFEMLLVVPKADQEIAKIEKELTADRLAQWRSRLTHQEVLLFIPKFQHTLSTSLRDPLTILGMPSAFAAELADFGRMSDDPGLCISAVLHKAFIEVNEVGTEAAAATGVVVGTTSISAPPAVVRADHPFLFFINDNRTGAILFMGRVSDPAGERQ